MSPTRQSDPKVDQIVSLLEQDYKASHRKAKIDAYRYNIASIRVRIIDPDFQDKSIEQREQLVMPILNKLDQEIVQDITMLLLITPEEYTGSKLHAGSLLSLEFDAPSPSRL